ncbi:MAG: hypothetical protein K0S35_3300, partial [Geminicoccaceae bacterium]|nr:hypothetical protein [Geminicoccaceae bacterium]
MTTRHPADTGPAQLDPPPHLRGALRAAAAARVRTARIRARPESGGPAGELPAEAARDLQPLPTALEAAESLAGTPRGMEDPRRHFARTVAAARQARSAAPAEGADAPWHLQLRHERAEASGRPPRWLSRLLAALSAQRRPARADPVALPAPWSAAVAGSPSRPPPAGATPIHRPPEPPALAPPAAPPSAHRREIERPRPAQDWPWQPADGARASPPEKERAGSRGLAESRVEGAAARSALTARWRTIPTGADDLDRRSALAAAVRAAGRRRAVLAAPSWARRLPTTTGAGGLPAPRLAALLASSLPALAHRSQASPGASDSGSAAQAAAGPRPERGRSAARLIAIGCAIVGGFGLGIVANGGALLTGSKLGEAMLELDRGLFGRSGSAPIAAHAPEPALRPPIARPQRAPAPGSEPAGETTAASQSGVAKAEGDAGAVEGGASEHGRFSPRSAPRERAATPAATATGWQALYAEGHRFQLHGNLVAAADAY